MPTNKKLTYTRHSKNLPIAPQRERLKQVQEQAIDNSLNSSRSISGYKKTDGVLSYNIVCVISGGERKERDFLRLLIKQKKLHSLRIVFISKDGQGLQPYQMQEKWTEIKNTKKFTASGNVYHLDAMDKVFLLTDVDEFYEQLDKILSDRNEPNIVQWIISNPCFEIWLYYCFKNNPDKDLASIKPLSASKRSQEMKHLGNTVVSGGLNPLLAFENMELGIQNSFEHYAEDTKSIPVLYATQMHKMAQFLIDTMNRNANEYSEFVKKKKEWREKMKKQL